MTIWDFSEGSEQRNLRSLVSQKNYRYPRLPKRASLGLRIVASAVMLAVLLTRFPATDLQRWPDWRSESWLWLIASLFATLAAFGLAAIRWQEVCRTLGKPQKFADVCSYFLAGQFIGNFLPTTVGGDILRVSRMGTHIRDHSSAFASVVIERLTGWVVLPLMTLLAFAFNPELVSTKGGKIAVGLAIGTLFLLSIAIYLAEHPRFGGRLRGNNSVTGSLAAVHRGLKIYRQVPSAMLRLLAAAIAFQVCLVIAVICTAIAIDIHLGPAVWFAFIPMVFIAQVLPVAIGGIGVREAALVLFLNDSGVSSGQSVVLGLLIYAVTLLASLAGVPAFVLGARHLHSEAGI